MMVLCVVVLCHLSQVYGFFSLADVYCFMLYYTLFKFSLVYLPVLILDCVFGFDIFRGYSWRVAFSAL